MPRPDAGVLERLERYYDRAPRAVATTEEVGPFTVFLRSDPRGWPFYARPRTGLATPPTVADVVRVRERQRELAVPEQIEWVGELHPGLVETVREAGLEVGEHPLMVLADEVARPGPSGVDVRLLDQDDPALGGVQAAIQAGFEDSDEVGSADAPYLRDLVARGSTRLVGAFDDAGSPVGGGSHQPREGTTELTGIAVVPRARDRGTGTAVTAALVDDARALGVATVFLSAGTPRVAEIYARVGFSRVGTACIAEAPSR